MTFALGLSWPVFRLIVSAIGFFFLSCNLYLTASALAAESQMPPMDAVKDSTYGDSIIYGMLGEPSNLIPYLSSDTSSSEVSGLLYTSLLKFDKNLNVVPNAAETFELLEDGLLLRFTLRKGILWQDGVELTTDDVEFTYRMMIDPKTPTAYAGDFKVIKEFTPLDRYNFEVRYEKPFPRAFSTFMGRILPKHLLQGQELRNSSLARKPVSSGPFVLERWDAGSQVIITANPSYFRGRPYLDRIQYRIIPDITTMFLELKAGKLDIMSGLTALQYLYQAKGPDFEREYATYKTMGSTYTYLGYNLKSPFFSDVRVRQALAHAIKKEDIIKGALLGQGIPTIGPYRPDSWAFNPHIVDYDYDPAKAQRMLREAGWMPGKSGFLEKNCTVFSFTLLTNQGNEQRIKTALIIQSQLKDIGIEVKIRSVEWAAFLKQFVMPGYFDAVVLAWTQPYDPDGYDVWHSSRANGGLNFINYANPEVDELLEAGRTTFDRDKRQSAYYRLQEILHDEQPYCFLYVPYALAAVQKRFRGVEPVPAGLFYNIEQWWTPLDEQRHRISHK